MEHRRSCGGGIRMGIVRAEMTNHRWWKEVPAGDRSKKRRVLNRGRHARNEFIWLNTLFQEILRFITTLRFQPTRICAHSGSHKCTDAGIADIGTFSAVVTCFGRLKIVQWSITANFYYNFIFRVETESILKCIRNLSLQCYALRGQSSDCVSRVQAFG